MPSGHPGAWELSTMERRYSVPAAGTPTHQRRSSNAPHHAPRAASATAGPPPPSSVPSNSEDLHAWSIYRQNLNSDFTDSALGSSEKSPLPYGNFQLRDSTVQSILSHPRYGPKSALGANMYTYLKFGLPRVFPPSRGPRDGSSGYDSSDDGSPHPRGGMAVNGGGYALRSRSDPDFRHPQPHHHRPYGGRTSSGQTAAAASAAWRARSSSEANLLSPDTVYRQHEHRRSMHDLRAGVDMHPASGAGAAAGGRRSKAGSHVSVGMSRRPGADSLPPTAAAASTTAAKMADLDLAFETSPFAYPHLQVRGLDVESRSNRQQLLLQGVSLEVRGGETLAVMATSEEEGTVLLDAIAGCKSNRAGHVLGDILLNGQCVRLRDLRNRVAYVRSERALNMDLSVEQTLYFTHWLRQPGARATKIDTKDRMATLIEDLGLEQVRHTKVRSLTTSEKRRLAVAVQLLLDTDILLLDRPTAGMDIFDTFFLIEFLRQWAAGGRGPPSSGIIGRAVILTLHPPTYEIFTMLSRIALLSAGRLMFCGRRRDMLPYFANADYPCPAYKNPSDYYLDLVTLDDLSAEAMLESSQRIEQLAEVYRRREEPLSDPGPPAGLPPAVRSANFVKQSIALLMCWWFWSQPAALSRWLSRFLLSVLISLIVGAIWWEIAASDPQFALGDRVGFLYATTIVAPWPLLLLMGVRGDDWRDAVASDIQDGLYSRFTFIVCKILFSFPPILLIWLAYLVPAYTMTGLAGQATDPNAFYLYIGYMLLYLCGLNAFIVALGVLTRCRRGAALIGGFLFFLMALLSSGLLHSDDLPGRPWFDQYASMLSPPRWLMPVLVRREYAPDVVAASVGNIMCRNKQVQHQDIIVQLRPCPPPNITAALRYHGVSDDSAALVTIGIKHWPDMWPPIALAIFWGTFVVVTLIAFPINALRKRWYPPSRCVPNRP